MAKAGSSARGKKLKGPHPLWQEGIGSLLLLAAAQQTGLLEALVRAIQEVAAPAMPEVRPSHLVVVARLVLTLLFLPVAGLARTWDLRSYTGTLLAVVTGRPRASSQRYTERFLARLAQAGVAERLTEVLANWTDQVWPRKLSPAEAPSAPAVFSIAGHRKAVYSDVLVPRGPIGKLGGKILGCRELVSLHDAQAHPRLATTYRGDQHLTCGGGPILDHYESATDQKPIRCSVVDREGMAAEFLAQLHQAGRQVITMLRSDQYEGEGSFEQGGTWRPWRYNRHGHLICEVAAAHFALPRPDPLDPAVQVEVALIRDWRKLTPVEGDEARPAADWRADLAEEQGRFWEEDWQAIPAPGAPMTPKLMAVITTGQGMDAVELARTSFRRWACQENAIRDWLIPLNLDTNHGYAKAPVVNSELVKRQGVLQRRVCRLEQRAQACRGRLARLLGEERTLQEQLRIYEPRCQELFVQVRSLEAAGSTEEPISFPIKARACATDGQVRRCKARLDKNAGRRQRQMDTCEASCRELRQILRQQAELQAQARAMFELDHAKDQIMTLFKLGLANLGMWVRDAYFSKSYDRCSWPRLWPFFKLGGWITRTAHEVQLDVCAFNNRALVRDVGERCCKVNASNALLPDGRRLVMRVVERLRCQGEGPLVSTG